MEINNVYSKLVERLGGFSLVNGGKFIHLSDDVLCRVEEMLGNQLPPDYKVFLRDFGGILLPNVPVTDSEGDIIGSIESFYGVSTDNPSEDLVDEYHRWLNSFVRWPIDLFPGVKLIREIEEGETEISWPPELLPIGTDAGNNQICIALSGLRPGHIFLWSNSPAYGEENVQLISKSFDSFIRSLGE